MEDVREIKSVLVANRGEIASRVIRSCRKMGIRSIAIFSEADRRSLFVQEADIGFFIGPAEPQLSYLEQEKIIEIAKRAGADAIHPGYGFLAENDVFAKRCAEEGIIFIGPNIKAIEAMGSKSKAKILMQKHGIPVIPGYEGIDQSESRLKKEALELGFPLLIKAVAGGGGKGMRIVNYERELASAINGAKREALTAFGNDELIIEKYIDSSRHIEFQILGDKQGNIIHILERECTIQRRYQKVIEESPSPVMTDDLRRQMGNAAIEVARALNYDNAGTVEFIFDEKTSKFYFLEVNTRLQVEHTVTEEITGLDLVQLQIESAEGRQVSLTQDEVKPRGYAVEARVYAEDPENNFLPETGKIHCFKIPEVEGLRVETAIGHGSEISIFYDPMIAKLIVWSETRATALRKMGYVLNNMVCLGLNTNLELLRIIFRNENFNQGNYDTQFINREINLNALSEKSAKHLSLLAIAATISCWNTRNNQRTLLKTLPSGWRNNFYQPQKESFLNGKKKLEISYKVKNGVFEFDIDASIFRVLPHTINGKFVRLSINDQLYSFNIFREGNNCFVHNEMTGTVKLESIERFPSKSLVEVKGGHKAPMPSKIIKVLVEEGQKVKEGDNLVVLSSMKMENTIIAEKTGIVESIYAEEGQNIETGFLLLKILSFSDRKQ